MHTNGAPQDMPGFQAEVLRNVRDDATAGSSKDGCRPALMTLAGSQDEAFQGRTDLESVQSCAGCAELWVAARAKADRAECGEHTGSKQREA